jgi:hypothetical protein
MASIVGGPSGASVPGHARTGLKRGRILATIWIPGQTHSTLCAARAGKVSAFRAPRLGRQNSSILAGCSACFLPPMMWAGRLDDDGNECQRHVKTDPGAAARGQNSDAVDNEERACPGAGRAQAGDRRFGCRLTGVSHISNRFRSNLKESKHAISHPHPGASRV